MATQTPTPNFLIRYQGAEGILRGLASRALSLDLRSVAARLSELAGFSKKEEGEHADHAELGRRAFALLTGRRWPVPAKRIDQTEEQYRLDLWRLNETVWRDLHRIGQGGPF